ncbi:MAG TPA: PspC domain-containing protein [Euzebyales bacterium]|nr:PspC domain-containing protein [Euzebyales bacterium]
MQPPHGPEQAPSTPDDERAPDDVSAPDDVPASAGAPDAGDQDGRAEDAAEPSQRAVLRRSRDDKVIAGVAGGLGRYLGVDPVIIRVAFVVLAVSGGSGLLLYLIGMIAIPEERPGEIPHDAPPGDQHTGVMILGGVLVVVGGLLLADRVVPNLTTVLGPLVLIGLGAAVIVGARR